MTDDTVILSNGQDAFMKKFKYYKSNRPKPSLKEVLSCENEFCTDKINSFTPANINEEARAELMGLHQPKKWQTYTFPNHPGLLLIRNPFTSLGQRYWIRKCLQEYPKKPNKLNIDIEVSSQDWWVECYLGGELNKQLERKLRWTTLGYHHDWDTKVYSDENKNLFPEDLAELSDVMATYLGYKGFKAEAAIVNYYHMNSTLSAHTDHSEVNLEAPLFSFSFGQSAIFMLGGQYKSVEPSAILLQSGDVVVMSKEARLCYHAVPKILPAKTSLWLDNCEIQQFNNIPNLKYISNSMDIIKIFNENADNTKWRRYQNYIQEARINMNVRQVLNERQKSLTDLNFNDS